MKPLKVVSDFAPGGDQPQAIEKLSSNLKSLKDSIFPFPINLSLIINGRIIKTSYKNIWRFI